MASSSSSATVSTDIAITSRESILNSEKLHFRRVPNLSIPTVIVTKDNTVKNSKQINSNNEQQQTEISNEVSATSMSSNTTESDRNVVSKATDSSINTNKSKYCSVVISLENPILPKEIIENTPSMRDGLDFETEYDLRVTGCKLIQVSGILLRLPQVSLILIYFF